MRKRIARIISNVLNPFILSAIVLLLLSFRDTASTGEALKWAGITLAISVVPILIIAIWLVRRKKMDSLFDNTNYQRRVVYLLASILGAIGCGLMWVLKAPELLAITFTTGFIELVVFMGINYYWKISLHTAFTAATIMVVSLVYGVNAIWTVVLLPLVAWSRIELKQHSLLQVIIAAVLAAGLVAAVFGGFGKL
jgi:membrane-associated phospholipid phosphatase